MRKKLKAAGVLLLAFALLAGVLSLFARRKTAGPPNIPIQEGPEVVELRDPEGPRSVLYQYRDWD